MSAETQFTSPFGVTEVVRFPVRKKETLRAWDAADAYLLNHLADSKDFPSENERILLVNDQFGALACQLADFQLVSWSDSLLCHKATEYNLKNNQLDPSIQYINSLEKPTGHFTTILIKVPKTLAFLDDQLRLIHQIAGADTRIIAAGMDKHLQSSMYSSFEQLLGPITTSLAVKKARLIFAECDANIEVPPSPYPKICHEPNLKLNLSNHANVFSKEQLDIGARFMIQHLPGLPVAGKTNSHIIDLGCGNGVLGLMAKRYCPGASISFVDESYMALDSAKTNFVAEFNANDADFIASDCLTHYQGKKADIILCNPPFHQQHTVSDHIARRMFSQCKNHLANNGQLWVIANRHLGYFGHLKRLFGNCNTLAANKKFVILVCHQ